MNTTAERIIEIQESSEMSDEHRNLLTGYVDKLVMSTGKERPFIYGNTENHKVIILEWAHPDGARFQVEVDLFAGLLESIAYIVDMHGDEDQRMSAPLSEPHTIAEFIRPFL